MDAPLTDFSGRVPPRSSPISLTTLPLSTPMHSSSLSLPMSPPPPPPPLASPTGPSRRLEALRREQAYLAQMKTTIPNIWNMVETEIMRIQGHYPEQQPMQSRHIHPHSHLHAHSLQSAGHPHSKPPAQNQLPMQPNSSLSSIPQLPQSSRKRIKLRVPAEKYPDYNFVGRLLGPRGATLKKLERDTGCKIMIRGRGSIRKDKESEVRGKPGWEHVFNETLHVVIEVSDAIDEGDATRILTRAREMVELLLVPVPEERDTLKRQQLRDLAILNGTFRANDGPAVPGLGGLTGTSVAYQAHPARAAHMIPSGRDFGIPGSTITHCANSNMEPGSLAQPDSLLSRRRTAPLQSPSGHHHSNNINFSSGASHIASSPIPLTRHNSLMDGGSSGGSGGSGGGGPTDGHYSSSRNHINSSHNKVAAKSSLPSRSDSYLPDIGSLHIPSLEIETMTENFLVSPILGHHGLPGPSPTIVDPEMYPFPSTPSVLSDHPAAFGSPIWSGPPQSSSVLLPSSSPQPVGSSPLPSPPSRSPPHGGSGEGSTTPAHTSSLPAIILTNNTPQGSPVGSTQKFGARGEGLGMSYGGMAKAGFQGQHGRGGREHPKRGGLFDNLGGGGESSGEERVFGNTAFANYFPKVTGVQGQKAGNGTQGDKGGKNYPHAK